MADRSDGGTGSRAAEPVPDGPPTPIHRLWRWLARWELLIVCLLLIAIFAMRQTGALPGQTIRVLDSLLVAAVVLLAMHSGGIRGRRQLANSLLAAAAVAIAAVGVATSSVTAQRVAQGLGAYLTAVTLVVVVSVVLRQQHVTGDTLFGACAAYLATAVMFAIVYTLVARGDPAAFEPPQPIVDGQSDLYYFSFVTVTTLGYGDISPVSNLTRVLAPIEAVIGLILVAGLVGRIVGLLVAQATVPAADLRTEQPILDLEQLVADRPDDRETS